MGFTVAPPLAADRGRRFRYEAAAVCALFGFLDVLSENVFKYEWRAGY